MNRRAFLKLVTFLNLTTMVGCGKKQDVGDKYPNVSVPSFSSQNLHRLLDKLLNAYEAKGMKLAGSLLPSIGESELKKRCRWFPGSLPPEIVSLYAWRGGQEKDAWDEEYPFWFRDMSFCSLERAENEYSSMMQSYGAEIRDHELLKYSFPFASFNGGWYVLPTKGQPFSQNLKAPIICVLEGIDIYYFSIEKMVETCIDWVSHEKYNKEYTLPEEVEYTIWKKYNPGIFGQKN